MQNKNEKHIFIDACKTQLVSLYNASKQGKKVEAEKYRVQGFMHAGELMGLISKEEGKALIADLHIEVFGETIDERAQRKRKLDALKESDLDAAYFGESDRSFRFYPITFSSSFSSLPVLP